MNPGKGCNCDFPVKWWPFGPGIAYNRGFAFGVSFDQARRLGPDLKVGKHPTTYKTGWGKLENDEEEWCF